MLRRTASALCAAILICTPSLTVFAAPPTAAEPSAAAEAEPNPEADSNEQVDQAIEAWRRGEWTEVRDLLEPLVRDGDGIIDELLRESALRYLTEATLLDEGLDPTERVELARGYVLRLLEKTPDWTPPSGLHGREFYDLVAQIRSERDAELAEACRGRLLACEADLTELQVDHENLEADYATQEVAVRDIIKRNRGLALLPLGIGHFTNDNPALGGTFLALELATGIAGLSLVLYRVRGLGCVRTNGFAPKSLVCPAENDADIPAIQDHVVKIRDAEMVMGYLFLSSIVLDIVVAQALFKPIEVVDRGKMTREQLERETASNPDSEARRNKPRNKPTSRLEIRPRPTHFPGGVGFGLDLRF